MSRILVTGSSGLVGSRFVELSKFKDFLINPASKDLDITSAENVKNFLLQTKPDVVINFAAYTNVAEGEKQSGDKTGLCWQLNVGGVQNLLTALQPKTRFIQISTDMVFTGLPEDPGPYSEDRLIETDVDKLTWYGFTKAEAERLILEKLKERATIVRLIYPVRAKYDLKLDYLRKPLKLFDEGKLYPMFTDQQVSFAFIDEACLTIDKIIEKAVYGIFHVSSSNTTTPFDLYTYLIKKARGKPGAVKAGSLDEFLKTVASPVRYPKFGGLGVEKTEKALGIKFSSWKEIIDKLINQGIKF